MYNTTAFTGHDMGWEGLHEPLSTLVRFVPTDSVDMLDAWRDVPTGQHIYIGIPITLVSRNEDI